MSPKVRRAVAPASGEGSLFARAVINPLTLIFLPVALSGIAWLIPEDVYGRRWRYEDVSFPATAGLYTFAWYAMIMLAAAVGVYVASRLVKRGGVIRQDNTFGAYYMIVTAAATIGFIASLIATVQSVGLSAVLRDFATHHANEARHALYQDYHFGVLSLRYLVVVSGGIGLFLLIKGKEFRVVSIWNVAMLTASAIIASREILIAGAVTFAVIAFRTGIRIPIAKIALVIGAVFLLLMAANSLRNGAFYERQGLSNPVQAAFAEEGSYLASPFQGAIAAGAMVATGDFGLTTGIDPNLTTDSAALDLAKAGGVINLFVVAPLTILVLSTMFSAAIRSGNLALIAGAGAWGLGFCEIWRLWYFDQGIFYVLFVFGLLLPAGLAALAGLMPERRVRRRLSALTLRRSGVRPW